MKELPTQERALKKRSALIDAAMHEFEHVGFEVATAKSIAAKAGVATGTFYQYFENKNDILRVIAHDRFVTLHERIQILELQEVKLRLSDQQPEPSDNSELDTLSGSALQQQFFSTLEFLYQFHAADPELHKVLEQRRDIDPKLKAILDSGEAVLQKRVLLFVQSFNVSHPELVAENLFAMAEGLVHRLAFQKVTNSQEALKIGAQMLASYFVSSSQ